MENENITQISKNTLQDACPECDTPLRSQKGIKGFLQMLKSLSWKAWLIIAAVVALLIGGGLFVYDRLTNTYKTPLDRYMDYMNSRNYSFDKEIAVLNEFTESEFVLFDMCNRMSDDYLENLTEDFEEDVKYRESKYGKNYQYHYKIEDKDKLTNSDVKDFEKNLAVFANFLQAIVEHTDDFDSDDWEEFADSADLFVLQARLYVRAVKNLYQELKHIEVTEGYELNVNIIVEGSNLDEPEEHPKTMRVYKIDGRWVSEEFLEVHLANRTMQWITSDLMADIFPFGYYPNAE